MKLTITRCHTRGVHTAADDSQSLQDTEYHRDRMAAHLREQRSVREQIAPRTSLAAASGSIRPGLASRIGLLFRVKAWLSVTAVSLTTRESRHHQRLSNTSSGPAVGQLFTADWLTSSPGVDYRFSSLSRSTLTLKALKYFFKNHGDPKALNYFCKNHGDWRVFFYLKSS